MVEMGLLRFRADQISKQVFERPSSTAGVDGHPGRTGGAETSSCRIC